MQQITQKQGAWVRRWSSSVTQLLDVIAILKALENEYDSMGYATGAPPVGGTNWNLTDDAVQSVLPSGTADQVNLSVGAINSVYDTVLANQGYLQPMRP